MIQWQSFTWIGILVLPFVEIKEGWKASYIKLSCNLTRKRHGAAQRFCHYRRVFWLVDVHGGKGCGTFKFFSRRLVVRLQPLAMTTPGRVEHCQHLNESRVLTIRWAVNLLFLSLPSETCWSAEVKSNVWHPEQRGLLPKGGRLMGPWRGCVTKR